MANNEKKTIEILCTLDRNQFCADCNSPGPVWCSVNTGVFISERCAGIHRGLGVHISKVRSVQLDKWAPEDVLFMQTMGNARAAILWEATLSPGIRPLENADDSKLSAFIKSKYVDKQWALPQQDFERELYGAYNETGYYPSKEIKHAARKLRKSEKAKGESETTEEATGATKGGRQRGSSNKEAKVTDSIFGPGTIFPSGLTKTQLKARKAELDELFNVKD